MVRSFNQLKNKKGFTLIELIVVLAVLAIIMAIAVPRFTGVQEKAKEDSDRATLANIVKISEFYLVKGDMEKGDAITPKKEYTTTDLTGIIGGDFPNGVKFQSDGHDSTGLENVTVYITEAGVVSASIGVKDSTDVPFIDYPKTEIVAP